MSRWFRMYDDILDNAKVQRLPPDLFKAWVNLLALASKSNGVLPSVDDIAFSLRSDEETVLRNLAALTSKGLIDKVEDGLTPHNWSARQYKSDTDNTAAKRQSEKRARDKSNSHGRVTRDVTDMSQPPETEADTETEKKEDTASAASSSHAPLLIERYQEIERRCREAADLANDPSPSLCVIGPIAKLIDDGAVIERDILPVLREFASKGRKGRSWNYYLQAIAEAMQAGSSIKYAIPPPLSPETAAKAASLVWIDQGSDEWEAWRGSGKRWPVKDHETTKRPGWYVPSAMPPQQQELHS